MCFVFGRYKLSLADMSIVYKSIINSQKLRKTLEHFEDYFITEIII